MTMMWMTEVSGRFVKKGDDSVNFIRAFVGILAFILISCTSMYGQADYGSEADLIKGANELFESGQYSKAKPLFSQLVSLYPQHAEYNMKYGYSLFEGDENKTEGLKYLKFAIDKGGVDNMVNYYYARALHGNYNFSNAIKYYKKFKADARSKEVEELQIDRRIAMCNNGKELLVNVFDLNVVEKKDIGRTEFFRIYDIEDLGGKIIVKPDQFKSKLDIKSNDFSLIHLPEEARVIYYAGYGDSKSTGKDIFRSRKTQGGDWGPPENIGSVVNTSFDEDFPFMHPDGTLYFASKGHNSMGGYDLFKSTYNESTDTWTSPENLNFPINSPFDDVLFISDRPGQLAYFASERVSTEEKITVFRVQLTRKPFDAAFVSGNFIAENKEGVKSAKISIYDLTDNKKVGTYFTDQESGTYNIQLPKGGRSYKFVVETDDDAPVHTGKVDIPAETGASSLKQEIRLVGSGSNEKLVIKNLFDESSRTPVDERLLISALQTTSQLEVNSTVEEARSQPVTARSTTKPAAPSQENETAGLSPEKKYDKLISKAEAMTAELEKDVSKLQNDIAFGFRFALEKAEEADKLYEDLEVTRQQMINETNEASKQSLLKELLKQKEDLEPIASNAIVAYDFTASLANEYDEKRRDRDDLKKELSSFRSNGKSGDQSALEARNRDMEMKLKDLENIGSAFDIAPKRYADLLNNTNEKLSKQGPYYQDLKRDIQAMRTAINELEKEISASKNNRARDQKMAEKGAKEIDLEDMEYQFSDVKKKYLALKVEKKNLESDSKQLKSFIAKMMANTANSSQLNSEEQAELKKLIDYFKEQRLIEDVIGEEVEVLLAGTEEDEDLSSAHAYAAVDNAGNPLDYDQQYQVNLAAIELVNDAVKKNEERSKLYANWAETVGAEQSIQENHLKFTKKDDERTAIQTKIKALDDKKVEYRVKAEEYRVKALALSETAPAKEAEAPTEAQDATSSSSIPVAATSKETPKLTDDGNEALGGLVTAVGSVDVKGKSPDQVEESYKQIIDQAKSDPDKNVAKLKEAAAELNWAASNEAMIKTKETELSGLSGEKAEEAQKELDALKKDQEDHLKSASSEFTQLEMDRFVKGTGIEADPELDIPFDPADVDDDRYEVKFNAQVSAIELDYNLNDLQKSEELAQIHNNWTKTIQEEILHLSEESARSKDKGRQKQIASRIKELQEERDVHIERSNYHYQKVLEAAAALAEVAEVSSSEVSQPVAPQSNQKGTPGTVHDLRVRKAAELEATKAAVAEKEQAFSSAGNKNDKQRLAMELALLKDQQSQDVQAGADLDAVEDAKLLSESAELALADGFVNWKEEAEDYVFSNKDFNANAPAASDAAAAFLEAKKLYEEVQRLESEKQGMISNPSNDADAAEKLLAQQREIENKKTQAYLKLAEATNKEYLANKKRIEELLKAAGADLKKTNPKLYRQVSTADVIYQEVGKYQANANKFKSNSLKFDVYDQAQFMGEYVLDEQQKILDQLQSIASASSSSEPTGELAFLEEEGSSEIQEQPKTQDFKISPEEHDRITALPAFVEYEKDREALKTLTADRLELTARVESETAVLADLKARRDSLTQAMEGMSKSKRKKLMKEAEVLDAQIAGQEKRTDSLSLAVVQLDEQAQLIRQNSERLLRTQSDEDRTRMILLAEVRTVGVEPSTYIAEAGTISPPDEPEVAATDEPKEIEGITFTDPQSSATTSPQQQPATTGGQRQVQGESIALNMDDREFLQKATEIPKQLEEDLFIRPKSSNNITPYSAAKPIPIDEEIPTGLIFKVQVGAFRNPIPQDLFKGFAPVMGERIPNGITRYTAGLFRDFANANRAKNEIRRMGYNDAFVVAFMDGKRVSFQELQDLPDIDLDVPLAVQNASNSTVPDEVLKRPSQIRDAGQVSSAIAEQTQNTREVQGVFFTVQVGVYTNTILPEKLAGIRELNSELVDNGNIRYSAGQFKSVEEARQRREQMVAQGISDAFVTAYSNGSRIPVGDALKILNGE